MTFAEAEPAHTPARSDSPADLRRMAVFLASAAAEHIRVRRREVGVGGGRAEGTDVKSSRVDPVTVVDRESEELIRGLVASLRPGDAVFGEEEGGAGARAEGIRWVVDPIDGTVNFLYGIPAFGVSVACEKDGRIVAGAVADVAGGRIFHAAVGGGAALRDSSGREVELRCSAPEDLGVSLVATGFSYSAKRRAVQGALVADLLADVRDIRRIGSAALDLCLLAAGGVDCYFEHGLNLWDWAAGALIAQEAGAVVKLPDPGAGTAEGELVAAAAPTVADEFFGALESRGALGPISRNGG
ncbi:inositol monophosphatase family protein [Corynebacterium hansenii]|uniref:Inositol-1-monophosphatase n=1 Tax=Corynebacterium hansenii TaxID=394964 RepID=A0ABV7ZR26_9CORY|nr:inositol monophosphatase family protein [Corynebacterium hansenii]WJY99861.1 Inositol-1-monophosphatase SuhB [Corynebacterium hansenii]